jgi:adsorption protein B
LTCSPLYVLKSIAIVIAVVIFISGLDDLFIDLFTGAAPWRALTVYSRHEQMNHKALLGWTRSRWPSWCPPGRSMA